MTSHDKWPDDDDEDLDLPDHAELNELDEAIEAELLRCGLDPVDEGGSDA